MSLRRAIFCIVRGGLLASLILALPLSDAVEAAMVPAFTIIVLAYCLWQYSWLRPKRCEVCQSKGTLPMVVSIPKELRRGRVRWACTDHYAAMYAKVYQVPIQFAEMITESTRFNQK